LYLQGQIIGFEDFISLYIIYLFIGTVCSLHGIQIQLYSFLTSGLRGVGGQSHAPTVLIPGNISSAD
jgi:hypothetical protein